MQGFSEEAQHAAIIVENLPPEGQKLALDQLKALPSYFAEKEVLSKSTEE